MTLIAGVFNRHGRSIAESTGEALRKLISRHPGEAISVFADSRSYFVKVDIGAFGELGARVESGGGLSLLAGELLLAGEGDDSRQSRDRDLELIHGRGLLGDWNLLRQSQGTFTAVHYNPETGSLSLIADKVGVRPLYYFINRDLVVFSTALRVLEGLAEVPKQMDVRAVTEIVGLGAPLGNRTPYAEVFCLTAAEIVDITESRISHRHYWRWDEIETSPEAEPERVREVYDRFQTGVLRRAGNDRNTVAYLSGGLDSRCVVSSLVQRGARVHTFNFARPGTQDYVFGNEFAAQVQTIHQAVPKEAGDSMPDYSSIMARAWNGSPQRNEFPPEHPQLVWSGEGGSVLLGHIHLSETLIELMRAGEIDRAIETFLQREQVELPLRLFTPQVVENIRDVIRQGIHEELAQLHAKDAGRNLYLFLMLNDQRRKLANHFENIDLHRLEFQLPFFDGGFIESVMATPIDWCLKHRFYVPWLKQFPSVVMSVPWQTYPEHEPCPIPVTQELNYQWDEKFQATERAQKTRTLMTRAAELLSALDFPHEILNKRNLRLAKWIHQTGWRDYEYAIAAASTYYEYWKNCNGTFTLPNRI